MDVSDNPDGHTPPARLLATRAGLDWRNVGGEKESLEIQRRLLSDLLLSPNLIVLCGLGTSMCVQNQGGQRVAPSMGDLWAEVSKDESFAAVIKETSYPEDQTDIESLLSRCHLWSAVAPTDRLNRFIARAEKTLIERCRFVTPDLTFPIHEAFLRKVGRRSTRLPRMKLFTTNYDRTFEAAASRTNFIVVDGFSHTSPQEFDGANFNYDFVRREEDRDGPEYIPNVFHLYKIHGSIDWCATDHGRIIRAEAPANPLIIYPRNSKFESSYNPPFIEMMSRLQLVLRQQNTGLLVIGFGFNDEHVSQPLLSAIRSNVGLKAAIVGPALDNQCKGNSHLQAIKELILRGDDRLAMVETTFEGLVPTLPDLVAATEEEEHRRRVGSSGRGR
jgi:hypothetical protein